MRKVELKSLAEYFGGRLPAGRIKDRDTRIAMLRADTVEELFAIFDIVEARYAHLPPSEIYVST